MELPLLQTTLRDPRRLAMVTSLTMSLLMLVGKAAAYSLTHSEAIFSDAVESVIHLIATAFVGFSLWYAIRPPDAEHPYGHGKIAYFSSGLEGGLILVAAFAICYSALQTLLEGAALQHLGLGLVLIAGLAGVNLGLGLFLIRVGRQTSNLVLLSNGQHVLTDMWTSLGVLAGVALVWLTGYAWLDPVVALLIAAHIGWVGLKLMRQSVAGLMEHVDGIESEILLKQLEEAVREENITGYHQVRHRRVNDHLWVEYHLQLPGGLSLLEAHAHAHAVEESIIALFPKDSVVVTAHLEPEAHEEAHPQGHAEPDDPLVDVSA